MTAELVRAALLAAELFARVAGALMPEMDDLPFTFLAVAARRLQRAIDSLLVRAVRGLVPLPAAGVTLPDVVVIGLQLLEAFSKRSVLV